MLLEYLYDLYKDATADQPLNTYSNILIAGIYLIIVHKPGVAREYCEVLHANAGECICEITLPNLKELLGVEGRVVDIETGENINGALVKVKKKIVHFGLRCLRQKII